MPGPAGLPELAIHAERAVIDGVIRAASLAIKLGRVVGIEDFGTPIRAQRSHTLEARRDPDPRSGRHPRAHQRARPDRMGGLRHGDQGGRGGRRDDARSTCRSTRCRRPSPPRRWPRRRSRPAASAGWTSDSGAAACRPIWTTCRSCSRPACSASSASCRTPAYPSSRRSTPAELRAAMRVIAGLGGLLLVHAEDPAVLHTVADPAGPGLPGVRRDPGRQPPRPAAIAAVLDAAAATRCRVHIVHLSVRCRCRTDPQGEGQPACRSPPKPARTT